MNDNNFKVKNKIKNTNKNQIVCYFITLGNSVKSVLRLIPVLGYLRVTVSENSTGLVTTGQIFSIY